MTEHPFENLVPPLIVPTTNGRSTLNRLPKSQSRFGPLRIGETRRRMDHLDLTHRPYDLFVDRITVNPNQMGGIPCIRGMRIPVATVVGLVADGLSTSEILL